LRNLKKVVQQACDEVIVSIREEHKIKTDSKGNVTWYNFDQSIKVEVDVKGLIRFDDVLIDAAKEKLMQLIGDNINGDDFVKSLVMDAFQTSSGQLDTRRILGLKKYSSRINNLKIKKTWDEAMQLIDQSITRPESKTYFRIWVKDEKGQYKNIDLNFSNIN
jgi:hypothetical protein